MRTRALGLTTALIAAFSLTSCSGGPQGTPEEFIDYLAAQGVGEKYLEDAQPEVVERDGREVYYVNIKVHSNCDLGIVGDTEGAYFEKVGMLNLQTETGEYVPVVDISSEGSESSDTMSLGRVCGMV